MNITVQTLQFTDQDKKQVCAWIQIDDGELIPFYVSLEIEDDSEIYKFIKTRIDSGELIPNEPEIDLNSLASEMRAKRNNILSDTDYLIQPDYPISDADREAVKAYRQALRDITKQDGFPRNVVWPDKPEVVK